MSFGWDHANCPTGQRHNEGMQLLAEQEACVLGYGITHKECHRRWHAEVKHAFTSKQGRCLEHRFPPPSAQRRMFTPASKAKAKDSQARVEGQQTWLLTSSVQLSSSSGVSMPGVRAAYALLSMTQIWKAYSSLQHLLCHPASHTACSNIQHMLCHA